MPDTMIERAEKAVLVELITAAETPGFLTVRKDGGITVGSFSATAIARAVLAAMREPTDVMVQAADASDYECSEGIGMSYLGIDPAIPYRAMIDAALAEGV